MTKYIPCTHCVGHDCKICDYRLHKKAIAKIQSQKDNLLSLREHFRDSEQHKQTIIDFETMTDVLGALELVK